VSIVIALTTCWLCNRRFACDPDKVCIFVEDGVRQPLCRTCVEAVNPARVAAGLDPFVVLPGAYRG
jgi:hypothetical protein